MVGCGSGPQPAQLAVSPKAGDLVMNGSLKVITSEIDATKKACTVVLENLSGANISRTVTFRFRNANGKVVLGSAPIAAILEVKPGERAKISAALPAGWVATYELEFR